VIQSFMLYRSLTCIGSLWYGDELHCSIKKCIMFWRTELL